jgi:hypothetical protein
VSYYIASILFLNPDEVLSIHWINLSLMKSTIPDVFVWHWSPFKSVSVFSLLLICRFFFISMVVFCINLTQKKFQFGFVFPLFLGLIERRFDDFFPSLSSYTIMPLYHSVLSGKTSLYSGLVQRRVSLETSLLYWGLLVGITVIWAYSVSSKKDFAILEDNQ